MKLPTTVKNTVLTLSVVVLAMLAGTATSQAGHKEDKKHWKKHNYYHSHNDRCHPRGGYYRYYAPRNYVYYQNHRGYWEDRAGFRIFIRIP